MTAVLITGACSFTGRHLTNYLSSLGDGPIVGSDKTTPDGKLPSARFEPCDARDGVEVRKLIQSVRPRAVYHLAGASDESDPATLIRMNIEGTWHLLDACRQLPQLPQVLLIGSAAGYGVQPIEKDTFREDIPACPNTFYGLSRETELGLGRLALAKWGLPVFLCRPFNLIGPGLSERYAPAAILRRLLSPGSAGTNIFPLRNSNAIRDFVDVRDVVRAYSLILKQGRSGVIYNIGCGRGVTVAEVTKQLAGLTARSIRITEADGARTVERSQTDRSVANHDRLTNDTGWRPEISLEQSLADMVQQMRGEDGR
jgi:GDP-4-dehydro-6-deoxy-D-mannose reductase